MLSPKTSIFNFSDPILENVHFYFASLTHVFSTNLQIYAVRKVPMDHTDHVGFQQKIVRIWGSVTKKMKFAESSLFESSVKKGDFIGKHVLLFLKVFIYIYIYIQCHIYIYIYTYINIFLGRKTRIILWNCCFYWVVSRGSFYGVVVFYWVVSRG